MSFDDNELRKALDARSGQPSPDFRARLRLSLAGATPRPVMGWTAVIAVVLVTLLTAGSVGVLVASRHARPGSVASGARVTPPPQTTGSALAISAPSQSVVWILVDPTNLYRSTDQGAHWESRPLPAEVGVHPFIGFIDANQGWLLAPGSPATQCQEANPVIWHTTDGAATWHRLVAAGLAPAQCKEVIHFTDETHGFVTAYDPNHQPTVYRTADGGRTWRGSAVPDNPIFTTGAGGFTLRVSWIHGFGSTVYLEASGTQHDPTWPRDFIYTSTDGGATWRWKQKIASPFTFLVSESRWLQLAPDVEESTNGGQAFSPFDSDLHATAPQTVFAGAALGYTADAGRLWRTTDGGAHWSLVGPGITPAPSASPSPIAMPTSADLSAPSADLVWALIGGLRLFMSSDRGQTWQERAMPKAPAGSEADEISFVDDTYGWMSTCANTTTLLWKTTDGARTWHTVSSPFPPDRCLLGLSFVDRSQGFIPVNYENGPPAIFSTPDGGETWNGAQIQNPPGYQAGQPGYAFTALRIGRVGTQYLLAARGATPDGDVAWVFRSSDGGQSFSFLESMPKPGGTLVFVTATRWVQLLLPGQSLETLDGGKSWHAYASDYSQAAPVAPQVVFASGSVGYATVRGEIQRTLDGGAHWASIATPGT